MTSNIMLDRLEAVDTRSFLRSDCLIQGLWHFRGASSIDSFDYTSCPPTNYAFHLVLTGCSLGCCYTEAPVIDPPDSSWIGQDARSVTPITIPDRIALIDSILGHFKRPAQAVVRFNGTPQEKSDYRAKLIALEVDSLAREKGLHHATIVMLGVVGKVMTAMRDLGLRVQGIDLNTAVIGQDSGGVTILDRSHTSALLAKADIALVSGMALLDASLDMITATCDLLQVPIVMYAQTGSNCGPFYVDWGIARVISESFPIYTLQGQSQIQIYR
jgi:hypothetical protein